MSNANGGVGSAYRAALVAAIVALLGAGTVLALAGAARSDVPLAALGGGMAGLALLVAVAVGWTDGLTALVLTLPLPALTDTPALRLTVAAPATGLVVLGWLLRKAVYRERLLPSELPHLPLALTVAALALSALIGTSFASGARELLNFAVMMALLVVATDALGASRGRSESLVSLLVLVGGACGTLAVLEAVDLLPGRFPRWGTPYHRAALGFGQPNALAMFLAPLIPLAVYRLEIAATPFARRAAVAALAAMILGLTATFSRGSWLAVVAGTLVLLPAGQIRWAVRLWLATIATAVLVDLISGGMLRDTFQRTLADWVLEQRAALMLAGVLMFLAQPLAGVGLGGYATELDRFGAQIPQLFDYLPTPHNALVQVAAEAGLIGLIPFVWLLAHVLVRAIRRARAAAHDPAEAPTGLALRRALVWSAGTVIAVGFSDWIFSHGPGQVAVLILALCLSASDGAFPPARTHAADRA